MHAKFFLFSPNLLAVITPALDNALILASWRKKFDCGITCVNRNVSLKQQKNKTFLSIRESLRRQKFLFWPIRESLCSRKFLKVALTSEKTLISNRKDSIVTLNKNTSNLRKTLISNNILLRT